MNKPKLILCSEWREIAKEMRKQLKPYDLTVIFRHNLAWGDMITVEVKKCKVKLGDDDNSEYYCWHKVPFGKGPYCTGCGGLIKK